MNKIEPGSQPKLTLGGYIAENPMIIVWYAIFTAGTIVVASTRLEFSSDAVWLALLFLGIGGLLFISGVVRKDIRKKNKLRI